MECASRWWDLSLKIGIPCLNGYSGGAHHRMLNSYPRRQAHAEELVERLNQTDQEWLSLIVGLTKLKQNIVCLDII